MTDNEIIKSLELCANNGDCKECAINPHKGNYGYCTSLAIKAALDLINRQQSDKEALIAGQETMSKCIEKQQAEIERLQNTIIALSDYLDISGIDKTDTSFVQTATELNAQIRANVKSEAIEEFVERLNEKFSHMEYTIKTNRKTIPVERIKAEVDAVLQNGCAIVIDKVFKELEGEENANRNKF